MYLKAIFPVSEIFRDEKILLFDSTPLRYACDNDKAMDQEYLEYETYKEEIQFYVDRFVQTAKYHGINVDASGLLVEIQREKIEGKYCGAATSHPSASFPRIIVSRECWDKYEGHKLSHLFRDSYREVLDFHELGHALLVRNCLIPLSLPRFGQWNIPLSIQRFCLQTALNQSRLPGFQMIL